MNPQKLKRAVLKEELWKLTGDPIAAIVLQQFLYWSERTYDVDRFLEEESNRNPDNQTELTYGWIYKAAEELEQELMGLASGSTLRRRIIELVKNGWLDERRNPKYAWDRTLQYRPNIRKIQFDLFKLGYVLSDYPLQFSFEESKIQPDDTIMHSAESNLQCAQAIPDITPDTTSKEYNINTDVVAKTKEMKSIGVVLNKKYLVYADKYTIAEIQALCSFIRASKATNPAGLFVSMIKNGERSPDGLFHEQRQYIGGEYADLIEH